MRALGASLLAVGAIAAGLNFVRQRPDSTKPDRHDLPLVTSSPTAIHLEAIRSAGL